MRGLDFGDLDFISKVTGGLKYLKFSLKILNKRQQTKPNENKISDKDCLIILLMVIMYLLFSGKWKKLCNKNHVTTHVITL